MPLHAGASGRAILAFLPEAEIESYLQSGLPKVGPNTVTDRAELRRLLEQTREKGLARSRQESASGIAAISVPVFLPDGRVAGSLSISGPENRLTDDVLDSLAPKILESGVALSRELGYRDGQLATNRVA
jgi:DNA-binding IclR family transcriptional regulator